MHITNPKIFRPVNSLTLKNLNTRAYLHGTAIVKGVLDCLWSQSMNVPGYKKGWEVRDFEIRLKRKLMFNPTMFINVVGERHGYEPEKDEVVVQGTFSCQEISYEFQLTPTLVPCTDILVVDEKALAARMYETPDFWQMDTSPEDDIHVCLNEVSKTSNQAMFAAQPGIVMSPEKQTWFVSYRLPRLNFLSEPSTQVGVSKVYKMLGVNKMVRWISVNGQVVGERICVYA